MKVLTGEEMAAADRHAIEELGVPSLLLMENAGRACAEEMYDALGGAEGALVLVVCGKGSNGGDGLVIARHLRDMGAGVRVVLLWPADAFQGDAAANLQAWRGTGGELVEALDLDGWHAAAGDPAAWDGVVDAIFGTGLTGPVEGWRGDVIEEIADLVEEDDGPVVLAVDLPSGLQAGSPSVDGPAVWADLTVTMAAPKWAHVLPPAEGLCGDVVVAEIGIPADAIARSGSGLHVTDEEEVYEWAADLLREDEAHKGDCGKLLCVAGSVGKTGAAAMASFAALRSGAGLVTLATPRACWPVLASGQPEVMVEPLDDTPDGAIGGVSLGRLLELASGKDVLAVGPGVGRDPQTFETIVRFLREAGKPAVVDADALCALGAAAEPVVGTDEAPLLLTPHPGEMARLLGVPIEHVLEDRISAVRACADRYRAHVLLKGHRTLLATPGGTLRVNPTGNPGLASGGTGDILTGVVAGFLAAGLEGAEALALAAFLHGLAADRASEVLGETSLVATDLLDFLPEVIQDAVEGELEEWEEEWDEETP